MGNNTSSYGHSFESRSSSIDDLILLKGPCEYKMATTWTSIPK